MVTSDQGHATVRAGRGQKEHHRTENSRFVLTVTSDLGRALSSRDWLRLMAKPAANIPVGPVGTEGEVGARSALAVPQVTQQGSPLRGSPRHDCNQH